MFGEFIDLNQVCLKTDTDCFIIPMEDLSRNLTIRHHYDLSDDDRMALLELQVELVIKQNDPIEKIRELLGNAIESQALSCFKAS